MNTKHKTIKKYQVKKDLVRLYGSKCYYCDKYFNIGDLTLDHIYPKSKTKVKTDKATCVLACKPCNVKKGSQIIPIEDFRKKIMGSNYYPLTEFIQIDKEELKRRKHENNLRISSEIKLKENYAHNVVYPKNPIVKQKMTIIRFIKKLFKCKI